VVHYPGCRCQTKRFHCWQGQAPTQICWWQQHSSRIAAAEGSLRPTVGWLVTFYCSVPSFLSLLVFYPASDALVVCATNNGADSFNGGDSFNGDESFTLPLERLVAAQRVFFRIAA
jgi:hypothetical protein